jgi:2-polyprenyl-3-methyl-5-hydroxy-6-metoxy-1,4-benzoquinol methylase
MSIILHHPSGDVSVRESDDGMRIVTAEADPLDQFVSRTTCKTAYPLELIEHILKVEGTSGVCDEIMREEDPEYVRINIEYEVFGFTPAEDFTGMRVLDFGCGAGASSVILAQTTDASEIVGIDINSDSLDIARHRAEFYHIQNATFIESPHGATLPNDIGAFDAVLLSAVWEHLLPNERWVLLPKLWELIRPGGTIYINQTPHRWFPVEIHTTGLPFINYLPDWLAFLVVQMLSNRIDRNETWEGLLRGGIRGGYTGEIQRILAGINADVEFLKPCRQELRNPVEMWHKYSSRFRPGRGKDVVRLIAKAILSITGHAFVPALTLAIRKRNH